VRKMIDNYHDAAVSSGGPMIVHACGLDSLPSDIAVYMTSAYARQRWGAQATLRSVKLTQWKMRVGLSGGTLATLIHEKERYGISGEPFMHDPHLLLPADAARVTNANFTPSWYYDRDFGATQGVGFTAFADEHIVRRSGALLHYGPEFRFRETATYRNAFTAFFTTLGFNIMFGALNFPPIRWLFALFALKPGRGPTPKQLAEGWLEARIIAQVATTPESDSGDEALPTETVKGRLVIEHEPGYLGAAKMMVEAGLAFALDRSRLPGRGGGVHTPASAFGDVMIERLRRGGVTLEVGDAEVETW